MTTQLPLFARSIDQRFEEFHQANPWVYEELRRMALEAKQEGRKLGIRCAWEVLRWNHRKRIEVGSGPKLNDHFPSRYARLLAERESELKTFFETRNLRAS